MEPAVEIKSAPEVGEALSIDIARPTQSIALLTELQQIAAATGASYLGLIRDYAKLAFGPGKIAFDEYLALRLYDNQFLAGADKRAFVGLEASRKIWLKANYQLAFYSLVENKIAATALFAAYGFPVIPTLALFCNQVGRQTPDLLRDDDELRHFLMDSRNFPLFGKPLDGDQSLGSASFDRYDATSDSLIGARGTETPLEVYIAELKTHYGSGYLFQHRMRPHAAVRAICGERLATVRALTILTKAGPKLQRACWKIPAGNNAADNFWRPGNLLAQLDLASGRVLRVIRGVGTSAEELLHHPDTGAPMVGTVIPHWREIVDLALEGAKVLPDVTLIGWDIAPVDGGVVLVELNHTPDLKLPQIADARGIMDETFKKFLAEREQHAEEWKRRMRASARKPMVEMRA